MIVAKPIETSSTSQKLATQDSGRRLNGVALFSVLAALMFTLLLEALDQTVVGTALPRIIGSLQGFDRYTWVVTAFTHGLVDSNLGSDATFVILKAARELFRWNEALRKPDSVEGTFPTPRMTGGKNP